MPENGGLIFLSAVIMRRANRYGGAFSFELSTLNKITAVALEKLFCNDKKRYEHFLKSTFSYSSGGGFIRPIIGTCNLWKVKGCKKEKGFYRATAR